jgi:hypothetical protein
MTPLKILALGWYDRLNAGDDRMRYALSRFFEPHTVTYLNHWTWPAPIDLLREQDWVIIGGGGLWVGEGMGIISVIESWHPKIRARLGVIGVSIEGLEAHRPATEYLLEHAEFFHTRDPESARQLASPDRVQSHPDLTFGVPYDLEAGPRSGVVACFAGNFGGEPIDWGRLGPVLREVGATGVPLNEWGSSDRICLEGLGLTTADRFSIDDITSAELVISSRYHATLFCIQVGTPFVALACNRKIENTCRELGFDDWLVPADDPATLAEHIRARRGSQPGDAARLASARARSVELSDRQREIVLGILEARTPRRYDLLRQLKFKILRRVS